MFLRRPAHGVGLDDRDERISLHRAGDSTPQEIPELARHKLKDLSHDGRYVAAVSPPFRVKNSNKVELVVWDLAEQTAILRNRDYSIFDAFFDATGSRLLIHAFRKKVRCLDVASGELIAEGAKDIPLTKGGLAHHTNRFWYASHKKRFINAFDFATLAFEEHRMPGKDTVAAVVPLSSGELIYSDKSNVLRRAEPGAKTPRWERDLAGLHGELGRIWPQPMLLSPDERHLVCPGGSDDGHPFGVEWVIDTETGDEANMTSAFRGRGRLSAMWSASDAVTYTGKLVEILSGEVSDGPRPAAGTDNEGGE